MLWVSQKQIILQMTNYCVSCQCFKYLTYLAVEAHWTIISCTIFATIFKYWAHVCEFPIFWHNPFFQEFVENDAKWYSDFFIDNRMQSWFQLIWSNILIIDCIHVSKSFTRMINSRGPSTEPWPLNTYHIKPFWEGPIDLVFLFARKSLIHSSRLS